MVPPNQFIPLAEETGLILPIGKWVLESACAQLAVWSKQKDKAHLTIAVNLSAHQFHQFDFVDSILKVLKDSGANPQRLQLEVTESLLLENIEEVISKMNALKERGVGFSLDDFGTGYSSLSYLSRLPLDHLKIDRSFVTNLGINDVAVPICSAIISMAHSLKLKVVAEGVENETQTYILSSVHGCDYLQGYLYGKPEPIEHFEALLKKS
jgi:EAL domain-containing protein (putative c-di-GMP-specific phosphodiesterase class I)